MKWLLFLLIPFSVFAADMLDPQLAKRDYFMGEPIEITLNIVPDQVVSADFKDKTDNFFISKVEKIENKAIKLTVSSLQTGSLKTPQIKLLNGQKEYEIKELELTINPNTGEQDKQIKDIKGTAKAYEPDYTLLYIAGGLILAVILFFLIRKLLRRKKKEIARIVPQKTPFEVAMEYYHRAEELLRESKLDEFVDEVTAGVRIYIELKEGNPYLEMTTKEILKALKRSEISNENKDKIIILLRLGDRFKFADEALRKEDYDGMLGDFRAVLDAMERPRPLTPEVK